jgi:riboflavin synthase
MFTGIISAVGTLRSREPLPAPPGAGPAGVRVEIDTAGLGLVDVALGDSIAVDGCCLTVVAIDGAVASFDVSLESIARTAGFDAGRRVNLEKALRLSDRLGGHLVSGHVDGVGTVREFVAVGESWRLAVAAPATLGALIAPKGSVAVNGVSLTVNTVRDEPAGEGGGSTVFEVNLIPHTLAMTTLGDLQAGSRVNLEADLMARYVARLHAAGALAGPVDIRVSGR